AAFCGLSFLLAIKITSKLSNFILHQFEGLHKLWDAPYDLLVIDDFGLMDLNLDKCRDLFEIIEARDCRKSTVIISQMPVANWYQLFGDNTYADACLSRMTSKAYRLDFPGRDRRVESK
ncbi:ATP-binding protein, partial [Roseburia faecis]|uniref:ATP-binding protein n=1 Tax=Roseburia faecis TaxID=301302 RepID=UPI003F976BB0